MDDAAIVLLAGGEARRFPGKLERTIGGEPMLLRVYRRLRDSRWPVYVCGKGSFSPQIDVQLDCPLLIDRRPECGPLAAFFSACGEIGARRVFAVAADQPRLDASLLEQLAAAWQPGDESVVPEHDGRLEPLGALYDRRAVLREGFSLLRQDRNAMHALIERIRAHVVPVDAGYFANVNTPGDLERFSA